MTSLAIQVDHLAKRYEIGGLQQRHDTLRDALAAGLRAPLRRAGSLLQRPGSQGGRYRATRRVHIWALNDVSFEVGHGEVVGVIGRNGAGKSTLLKLLARITEPTSGRAVIDGRVGSLLEVGTGFHPELTGRENIYLNGAILGMGRAEIDGKFDEIVAFAEIEKFMSTPVKRYSSGMYVRLAFAVAAHLEPEILLVDEVLAVGDVAFQKKCLGKLGDVARQGRTVLFVSHNMAAVQALCGRSILLRQGRVWADGSTATTVAAYLRSLEDSATVDLLQRDERRGRGNTRLAAVEISTEAGAPPGTVVTGGPARFAFALSEARRGMACSFTIYDSYGQAVASFNSAVPGPRDAYDALPSPEIVCELDEVLLVPGRYRINVAILHNRELEDHVEGAEFFDVEQGQVGGRPVSGGGRYGSVCMRHRWIVPGSV